MSFPSICIPRLDTMVTKYQLGKIFKTVKFGKVENIKILNKRAFIYFSEWHNQEIKSKLLNGEDINIVYQFPFYIKCRANTNILHLKNIKLSSKVKKQTEQIDTLKQNLMYAQSYANYLSTNDINK
jgi:hypothetical protein